MRVKLLRIVRKRFSIEKINKPTDVEIQCVIARNDPKMNRSIYSLIDKKNKSRVCKFSSLERAIERLLRDIKQKYRYTKYRQRKNEKVWWK